MEVQQEQSRYDSAATRQTIRRGRERGVWLFVPAAELRKSGIDPHGPAPRYRVWGTPGGGVMARLYTSR
jgi:hypothetical protein